MRIQMSNYGTPEGPTKPEITQRKLTRKNECIVLVLVLPTYMPTLIPTVNIVSLTNSFRSLTWSIGYVYS